LHHRLVAADGSARDAMIAIEATEVASPHKSRKPVPVPPPGPRAGARPRPAPCRTPGPPAAPPDRSPIPLADNVTDGVAAVQASAFRARAAAGGVFDRLVLPPQAVPARRGPPVPR